MHKRLCLHILIWLQRWHSLCSHIVWQLVNWLKACVRDFRSSFHVINDDDVRRHKNRNNTVIMIQPSKLMTPPLGEELVTYDERLWVVQSAHTDSFKLSLTLFSLFTCSLSKPFVVILSAENVCLKSEQLIQKNAYSFHFSPIKIFFSPNWKILLLEVKC